MASRGPPRLSQGKGGGLAQGTRRRLPSAAHLFAVATSAAREWRSVLSGHRGGQTTSRARKFVYPGPQDGVRGSTPRQDNG